MNIKITLILLFTLTLKSALASDYSPESREYHLKAAFLRYVTKFVEWPPSSLPKEGTLNICILGLVPSFEAVNSINEKIVNDRTLSVNKILNLDQIQEKKCQMVFVTNTEKEDLLTIIKAVKGQPILTFGDMEHFAEKGGSMNFYIANNRLAIMANLASVEKSNLKINDQMLRLITVVPPQS